MRLVLDAKLPFTDSNSRPAQCGLKVYKQDGEAPQAVVIATEVADNPGMSITNCYETVANFATVVLGLHPNRTLWVEHYNAESYKGEPLPHEKCDRYSLMHLDWDGQRFSNARFVYLSESQLQGLLGSPLEQEELQLSAFDPTELTLEWVNTVAVSFGLQVVSAEDERLQDEPTIQQTGKQYVVIDEQGTVLSTCKDLDSVSMFLTLWSLSHSPQSVGSLDPEQEAIALAQLNAIAQRKGLQVITSETEGYRHHDWVVKYECRFALINRHGTVLTTARNLNVAEALVRLAADEDTEPLEL